MRLSRWLVLLAFVSLLPLTGSAQGPSGVAFHGIGDLPGGPTLSLVRDATRVDGVIYAVGGSAALSQVLCVTPNNPIGCVGAIGSDTAISWTWDGTAGQMTALPNLVANAPGNISIAAAAITPDAAYIASQARTATAGVRLAVRVNRSLLPGVAANTNLNVAPFTAYSQPTAAQAISANGSVLVTAVNPSVRVARVDVNNPAGNVLVPLLRPTDTNNQPAIRGISASGNVIIGTSFANPYSGTNGGQAFRYNFNNATNTGSISGVPFLPGGTWNRSAAISPNGQFTLVAGNSPLYPNGEYAIHDAATNTFTSLGSANTPWTPSGSAGMTADRAVVVATFTASNGYQQGYFHNANGWFHLESALGASGIDVVTDGWRQLVAGISADGTLVFGQGLHNGNREGFVAEFPAGYLANFDVPAVAATDTAIVGTWLVPSDTPGDPQPGGVIAFMADGSYIFVQQHAEPSSPAEAAGFERGRYTWNAATGAFKIDTVQDMNGDSGASDASGQLSLTATVSGDTLNITDPADPDGGPSGLTRLLPVAGTFVGGWIGGDATQADSYAMFVGLPDGSYYLVQDTETNSALEHDGFEFGTFSYDASTGIISGSPSVDTNGTLGFSENAGPVILHISADDLIASGTDDEGSPLLLHRIVDPDTVRPAFTSAGSVDGALGTPFTFATSATFGAFSFSATGLPAGLSIDGGTGVISGTPTALGAFAVNLTASNSLAAGNGSLVVTIVDGTAPTIDATANISETTGNTGGAPVVYTAPATHDNVDADGVALCAPASGSNFAVGTTTVNCSATDAAGNTATSSFTVTVTYLPPPPPSLPGHMHAAGYIAGGGGAQPDRLRFNFDVLQQPTGAHHLRFSFWTVDFSERPRRTNVFDATEITSVTFSDNPAFLSGHKPNAATIDSVTFSGNGEFNDTPGYTFTVTASDRGEPGKDLDTFSLEVRDGNGTVVYSVSGVLAGGNVQSLRLPNRRMPPFISGGPSTVTEIEATNANGAVFNYALPVATDMDGANVAVNCSPASGTVFPMGRTRITCTATDTQGRTSTERYRVIVSDSTAPVFTSTPSNITVVGTHATKGAKVDYTTPSATDAVDASVAVSCAPASGKWFDYGTTLITCTAKDNAKNKSAVTFTITVIR